MNKETSILMVDDHPMIIEGYKNALTQDNQSHLSIDTANDCDTALSKINSLTPPYELVLLDVRIPPCKNNKIISGEGLGIYLREQFTATKIIILTMFSDKIRLNNIIKKVDPEGFLIKSDVTPGELQDAVKTILAGGKYYSATAQRLGLHSSTNPLLDDHDYKILFHLAKGTKTKNLVNFIPLSLGAIEKRKRKIKEVLNINHGGDREILDRARELGFL